MYICIEIRNKPLKIQIMTTLEIKIENLVKTSTTEVLIEKLIETLGNIKMAVLNVMIQEELENRIGEDKLDDIIDANR